MSNKRKLSGGFVLVFAILLTGLFATQALAQLQTPRVSPYSSITQRIGITDVTITYHRPGVKDREIWGELVPYGKAPGNPNFGSGNPHPWRAGANENTTISFTHDVTIEGKPLAAGTYGLHMIPGKTDWTVIFSNNSTSWGSFFYDESEDALRVTVTPQEAEHQEWLRYGFEELSGNSAVAFLHWENLKVPFKIGVNSTEIVINNFKNKLRSTPGFNWQSWNQAAFYCLQNNVHLDLAEKWVKKSISMNENANNRNLLGYILMAQDKKDDALQVFQENVEKYPDNWNVHDSMGEAYGKYGQKKKAIQYYKKALSLAPQNQKSRIEGILQKLEQES
ncbi:MAG: DUF2911 domain-containing protein [candidate division Zixibacteria bacterium]|nr:DUF2911 domain-containing protein [candidate division Zixibacteria bacterium]NIV09368.1 DUF2911 domain-containing protein [candidate division Zixibacteria bacterium]NIX59644.1 DUF2911 domain-containing protein [candidate division Zixibacteria bacterium]